MRTISPSRPTLSRVSGEVTGCDDVGSNQQFEAEQDAPAEIRAVAVIGGLPPALSKGAQEL
jgi:hypothetical protein